MQKLLDLDFIKHIQHLSRLANIGHVKKNNGQIRGCIDFCNLNKACLKDEFPLPNIEMLFDILVGRLLFLLWMVYWLQSDQDGSSQC